jgi:SmpA / OmlA family
MSLNGKERTMNRLAVTVVLFLLTGLLGGCGSKDANEIGGERPKIAKADAPTPPNTDVKSVRTPKSGMATATTGHNADLMDMDERYKVLVNRIRPGMSKDQVEALLGTPDDAEEKDLGELNPEKAGQTLEIWKWTDSVDEKKFIMLSFVNEKLKDGGTPGYDIKTGFKSK